MDLNLTGALFDSIGSGRAHGQFNYPYESLFSRIVKFVGRNHLTRPELRDSLLSHEDGQKLIELGDVRVDLGKFVGLSGMSALQLKQACAEYYLGPDLQERLVKFRRKRIHYCPECVSRGFHSEIHQLRFFDRCPLHGITLSSICGRCGVAFAPGVFYSSPYLCRCGYELLRFESERKSVITAEQNWCRFKIIAEWLHAIGARWNAARQTIVPTIALSMPGSVNKGLASSDTNQFERLLDVWGYAGSVSFPECDREQKERKRPIDFTIVDLKADRCDWRNHWHCLPFVYIRRLCAIMKRYGTGHEEIAAMFAWRIFWEGIPVLRSSLGPNELKPDRLEEPICHNLDRLLGDFGHIKDLFGPETWKWIFDDVLQRTFSESMDYVRVRLYEGKRVIPSITGSKLVAYTIIQRDNKNYIFW